MASSFTVDDVRLLEKTINIRERIIDNYLAKAGDDLPTKPRDIDSITNLLESMDRSIIARAKVSIDEAANRIDEQTNQVLKSLLIEIHTNPQPLPVITVDAKHETPVYKSQGIQITEGELVRRMDNINVDEFLKTMQSEE